MNTTTITVGNEVVNLRFGIWTLARLSDRGFKMKDLQSVLSDNPFDFMAVLVYIGACNAIGRDLAAVNEDIGWDWLEEVGFNHPDVAKVMTCFSNSISQDVPAQKKSRTKAVK